MTDIFTFYVDGHPVFIQVESVRSATRSLDASGAAVKALGSMTGALESAKATILNVAYKISDDVFPNSGFESLYGKILGKHILVTDKIKVFSGNGINWFLNNFNRS